MAAALASFGSFVACDPAPMCPTDRVEPAETQFDAVATSDGQTPAGDLQFNGTLANHAKEWTATGVGTRLELFSTVAGIPGVHPYGAAVADVPPGGQQTYSINVPAEDKPIALMIGNYNVSWTWKHASGCRGQPHEKQVRTR